MSKKRKLTDAEQEWWNEDAERLNRMCDLAQEMGVTAPEPVDEPPELNPDGSEKVDDEDNDDLST